MTHPRPASSVAPAHDEPEKIAQDLLDTGAELKIKRRWWFGHATLNAEKAVKKLREEKRPLQLIQNGITLPVHNLEDLTEVAVFSHLRPVQLLKSPEVGEHILALEKLGPKFVDKQNRPLGGYGAYNALTDANHQSLGAQLEVNDHRLALELTNLPALAAFYQNDRLGQLELKGYQFFDQDRRSSPFGGMPAQVGKGHRPWLPANTPDLEAELEKFEQLMTECAHLEAAKKVYALKPTTAEIDSLIRNYGEARVLPGVMRTVDQLPTAEVVKLAGSLQNLGLEGQRKFLDLLAQRPETAPTAGLARRMHEGLRSAEFGTVVFKSALAKGPVGNGLEVGRFLNKLAEQCSRVHPYYEAEERKTLGQNILDELATHPETRAGAERIKSWEPERPFGLIQKLLANPAVSKPEELRALAAGLETGDHKMREKVLAELKSDPATAQAAALVESGQAHCSYEEPKAMLLRAAVRNPSIRSGQEAAALYRDALGQVSNDPQAYHSVYHRTQLSKAALEGLGQFPDTEVGARRVSGWAPAQPAGPTAALLANPTAGTPEELRAIAVHVDRSDRVAQDKVLQELAADPATESGAAVARAAWDKCPSELGKHPAYQAALKTPVVADGQAAAVMLEGIAQELDKPTEDYYRSSNQAALGQAVIEVLKKFPDTETAADAVAAWQPAHPHGIARKLLEHPTASTRAELWEIALGSDDADTELQRRVLTEMQADPATKKSAEIALAAMDKLYSSAGKAAAFRAALRHPNVGTGAQAAAMLSAMDADIKAAEDYSRRSDQLRLGQAVLDTLAQFPDTEQGARQVAAWKPQQPYGVAMGLLQNPGASSRDDLKAIALGATPGDAAMETAILAELKASPETEKAVTLLEGAYNAAYGAPGKTQIFRTALQSGTIENGHQAADLYRSAFKAVNAMKDDYRSHAQQALGAATLEGLEGFPETKDGAARLRALNPRSPAALAQALLKKPDQPDLSAIFLACDPNDHQFMRNVLAEQPHGELKTALMGQLSSCTKFVFEAGLSHPSLASGVEHAAFLADVSRRIAASKLEHKDSCLRQLGVNALSSLKNYPDTEKAATTLAAWGLGRPEGPVTEWLKTPTAHAPDDLRRYARALTPGESNAAALADLGDSLGKTMVESLYSAPAKSIAFRMALDRAPASTGAEAREQLKALDEKLLELPNDWNRQYDQAGFARGVAQTLASFPDTAAEAGKVAGWKTAPTYVVARMLLENPRLLSLKAFQDGFLTEGDRVRQEAVLSELLEDPKCEMAARIARVCCDEVKHDNTRFALVLGAMTTPQIRTSEDVDAFFATVGKLSAGHEPGQLKSLAEIYRTGFGLGRSAGVGLAEQERRILVGGVVVKKR